VTGAISGSGNLDIGGEIQFDGAGDAVAVMADSVYFRDADDGLMKRESLSDIFALADGDGVQINSGIISVPMVEHVYMSSSTGASAATGSINTGSNCTSFALGGNNYSSGIVTASFDVYLNGMLQVRSGSTPNSSTAWDYIVTGSGTQVLFEPADSVAGADHTIDDDDVVVIKYLVK
jgi:hypothetical protein